MANLHVQLTELESFVGFIGSVGDPQFGRIVDLLEETAVLVDEEDSVGPFTDFIESVYATKLGAHKFKLWFEVRRPDTPRMVLKFGFERDNQS